jgi:hypothetical protein
LEDQETSPNYDSLELIGWALIREYDPIANVTVCRISGLINLDFIQPAEESKDFLGYMSSSETNFKYVRNWREWDEAKKEIGQR